ncbi:MAG: hypothetical protein KBA51_01600, partial [Kiritimatiellae bacterium]|nr:hypothetical protein [Kiritimatiellia bacterium]
EDPKIDRSLEEAEPRRKPVLSLYGEHWWDNEDRKGTEYGLGADVPVGEAWRARGLAEYELWEREGIEDVEGWRFGLGAQWTWGPGRTIDGRIWRLQMDGPDDITGGDIALHVPNPLWSGHLEPFGEWREEETVEAVRANITDDVYGLRTYSRVADLVDVFANGWIVDRSDDNTTRMLDARATVRVREWPHVALGYRLRLGDSDFDPPEYWAPELLRQHQFYANLRGKQGWLGWSLSGEAGEAKERNTDWRFVWGARAAGEVNLRGGWGLSGGWTYFEGPIYNRHLIFGLIFVRL